MTEPPAATRASLVSALDREPEAVRARRLAAARRRATALLAVVAALFLAVTVAGVHGVLPGYVQAGAEAALVGGVADWFAVTALFRRPLTRPSFATAKDSIQRAAQSAAKILADQFHDELAGLVTGTIRKWDATETSYQLELLLGRDLQFIRINGTVVGACVGLALHAIVMAVA